MALTVAELNTRLTADIRDLQRGLDKAQKDISGFDSKASGSLSKFSGKAKLAAAAAGAAIIAFGKQSIDAARDLEEALNKSNTIFGANANAINQWATGAASDFGLSRRAALDAAGSFGNMFSQLGVGSDQAATLSQNIVELAADFASFHNADIEQVIQAQSAAFRGEYDALQRFLPLINAATVEQKALEMTGKRANDELTAQEKALAVNALMFEGAGAAAGDFDRTSGGLANQQRTLAAQIEDTQAIIGQKLQPVMLSVVQWLNSDGIPGFLKFTEVIGEGMADAAGFAIGALADIASAVAQVLEKVDQFIPKMEGVPERLQRGVAEMREMEASLHDVSINMKFAASETDNHATAQKALGLAVPSTTNKLKEQRDALIDLKDANFSLRDAQESAADAQQDLNDLLATGGVDAAKVARATDDLTRANEALADANEGVVDAQEDYNKALAAAGEQHLRDVERATDDLRRAQEKLADQTQSVADAEAQLAKLKAQRQARDAAIKNAKAQLAAADTVTERIIAQRALDAALGMEIVTDEQLAAAQSNVTTEQGKLETATDNAAQAHTDLKNIQAQVPAESDRVKDAADRLKDAQEKAATATDKAKEAQQNLTLAQQPAPGFADAVKDAQYRLETANWNVQKATWAAHDAQKAYNDQLNAAPKNVTTTVTRNETVNLTTNTKHTNMGSVTQASVSGRSGTIWVPSDFMGPLQAGWARLPKMGPYTDEQRVAAHMLGVPVLHDGGIVPGPRGADVPALLQAGERVIPAGQSGGGSDQPMIIQLVADGRVIQEILLGHQRRSGALGFN